MGLTTSREAIGRQASSIKVDPENAANGLPDGADNSLSVSNGQGKADAAVTEAGSDGSTRTDPSPPNMKKRKCDDGNQQKSLVQEEKKKKPRRKAGNKKVSSKKAALGPAKSDIDDGSGGGGPPGATKVNPHRARILIGKQALAAIKEGTRIFIKSGEGNGRATWWDSGVIQKIHERGKPYEVEWHRFNNRGEEVDTGVEKRIILPVTYSLAGAAAEAIQRAGPGTEAAAIARRTVLDEARIGSWCISHPEEPWGMLDPFGADSVWVALPAATPRF